MIGVWPARTHISNPSHWSISHLTLLSRGRTSYLALTTSRRLATNWQIAGPEGRGWPVESVLSNLGENFSSQQTVDCCITLGMCQCQYNTIKEDLPSRGFAIAPNCCRTNDRPPGVLWPTGPAALVIVLLREEKQLNIEMSIGPWIISNSPRPISADKSCKQGKINNFHKNQQISFQ